METQKRASAYEELEGVVEETGNAAETRRGTLV
jgi:hypothetical protein